MEFDVTPFVLFYHICLQGDRAGLNQLLDSSIAAGKHNVAFICMFLLGQVDRCVDLLMEAGRLPEAALLARAYTPSKMSKPIKVGAAVADSAPVLVC